MQLCPARECPFTGMTTTLWSRLKFWDPELPQQKAHLVCALLIYLLPSDAHHSVSASKVNA
jgi:hypothetical protein